MVTLNQLVYDLINLLRGGGTTDDDMLGRRQVAFWIINTRALLIRQDYDKGRTISDNIIQTISCLPVEQIDASMCPCIITAGCNIMRSVSQIPKPIETAQKDLIIRISPPVINQRPYSLINFHRSLWIGMNKYTRHGGKAFYKDRYIYLMNVDPSVSFVSVDAVFEDPRELANYNACNNAPCYDDNSNFPISRWMVELMKKMIVDTDIKVLLNTPSDMKNDAAPPVQPVIVPQNQQ